MGITKETRLEAYIQRPTPRAKQIMEVLGDREMTSREIAQEMGFTDMNAVKPRMTELQSLGRVKAISKKKDPVTNVRVAVWKKVQ